MATRIHVLDRSNRQLAGLEDGGKVILECSNCGKPLVKVWITRPNEILADGRPKRSKMQAQCCYCNDHSNTQVVVGGFHPGGYGEENELDPDSDLAETAITDIDMESLPSDDPDGCFQTVFFKTKVYNGK